MTTLRQSALNYESPHTLNIVDLPKVSLDNFELHEKETQNSEGEPFSYKYVIVEGKEYRVPNSVLEEIQKILRIKPDVDYVKVDKTGSGLSTRYNVSIVD